MNISESYCAIGKLGKLQITWWINTLNKLYFIWIVRPEVEFSMGIWQLKNIKLLFLVKRLDT